MNLTKEESTISLACIKMLLFKYGKDNILHTSPQQILETLVSCPRELTSEQRIKIIHSIMTFQLGIISADPIAVEILNKIKEGL